MKLYVAMKGLVVDGEGRVLIVREANTYDVTTNLGKYTLPGGRIELGEHHLDGLRREMKEEVGLNVEPLFPIHTGEWRPTLKGEPTQIIAVFYVCRAAGLDVILSDEHDHYLWVDKDTAKHLGDQLVDEKVLDRYFSYGSTLANLKDEL